MIYKHINGVSVSALFSKDMDYRYRLEISLKNRVVGGSTACVVMQNPSYAGEDIADKSVQFMEKVVFERNYPKLQNVQRLIVVNQFARIQTKDFKGLPHEIGSENNSAITTALSESDIIIIGWGSSNRFEERKAFVFKLLQNMSGKLLLKTKMHPSRGTYDGFIQPLYL